VKQVASEIRIPWFAIGGIEPDRIEELQQAGATRVAVSSSICGAENPAGAARRLAHALNVS